jgi:hypothetical protein
MINILREIWNIANRPLSVLLIGTGIGWLFINLIWTPYKEKKTLKERQNKYKEEVYLRLGEVKMFCKTHGFGTGIENIIDGFITMNPEFKEWKILILIYLGWSEKLYEAVYNDIHLLRKLAFDKDKNNNDKEFVGMNLVNKIDEKLKSES